MTEQKYWDSLLIVVVIPLSTTTFTPINEVKEIDGKFEFEELIVLSETNNLAHVRLEIDSKVYPGMVYFADASNQYVQKNKDNYPSYFCKNDAISKYPFRVKTNQKWKLRVLGINTHTADQKVYILLNGYRIKKEKNIVVANKITQLEEES